MGMTVPLDLGGAVEDAETVFQGQRPELSCEEFCHQESSELAPSALGSSSAPTELL